MTEQGKQGSFPDFLQFYHIPIMKSMIFWTVVVLYLFVSKLPDIAWLTWLNGFAVGAIAAYWAAMLATRRCNDD